MAHLLTWEPRGVNIKFFDACNVHDVRQAYESISGSPRLDVICYAIFDYLDLVRQDISQPEIVKLAALDRGFAYFYPSLRFASVATDECVLELWRQFVSIGNMPARHAVFPTVSAARDWLQTGDRC